MWAAKNKNGDLRIFRSLPIRSSDGRWVDQLGFDDGTAYGFPIEMYDVCQDLEWENDPIEVTVERIGDVTRIYKELNGYYLIDSKLRTILRGIDIDDASNPPYVRDIMSIIYGSPKEVDAAEKDQETFGISVDMPSDDNIWNAANQAYPRRWSGDRGNGEKFDAFMDGAEWLKSKISGSCHTKQA